MSQVQPYHHLKERVMALIIRWNHENSASIPPAHVAVELDHDYNEVRRCMEELHREGKLERFKHIARFWVRRSIARTSPRWPASGR